MNDFSQYEVLLEDWRVDRAATQVIDRLGHDKTDDWDFVTFVVPERTVTRQTDEGIVYPQTIKPKAVYAIVSPNPRDKKKKRRLMTHATVDLAEWFRREYAGESHDVAIFQRLADEHDRFLTNLRELI